MAIERCQWLMGSSLSLYDITVRVDGSHIQADPLSAVEEVHQEGLSNRGGKGPTGVERHRVLVFGWWR